MSAEAAGGGRAAPTMTKRTVLAQVSLCRGCCCGNVSRGRPQVPVERVKQEWKARGLSRSVQLTVSGCMGPCDVVNVVRISGSGEDRWLGGLESLEDYLDLVDWAERAAEAREFSPLPERLADRRIDPFRAVDRDRPSAGARGSESSLTRGDA